MVSDRTTSILSGIVILIIGVLITLFIYNRISEGLKIPTTPIIGYIVIGLALFAVIQLLRATVGAAALNLDALVVPAGVIILVVLLVINYPSILPFGFSAIGETGTQVSGFILPWKEILVALGVFFIISKRHREKIVQVFRR